MSLWGHQSCLGAWGLTKSAHADYDSSSRNAVSFSSACTTKRFPSPRCASAIQIVRPSRNQWLRDSPSSIRLSRDCQRLFPSTVSRWPGIMSRLHIAVRSSLLCEWPHWLRSEGTFLVTDQLLEPRVIHVLFSGCHIALKEVCEHLFANSRCLY